MIEHWINIALIVLLIANTLGAIVTVFRDRNRDITTVWAWMLVLLLFPVFGFAFYFFFGRKLSNKRIFDIRTQRVMGIDRIAKKQKKQMAHIATADYQEEQTFVRLFLNNEQAIFTNENHVSVITDGKDKFAQLFADIEQAKHHVNVEYYTIYDDEIGNQLVDLLTKKAAEGVRVRVIYDMWGSGGRHKKMFKRLHDAGGQIETFLIHDWQPFSFRVNNHDHRKLVIIDGNIGYIGGFNVGDQYLGKKKKFGYWRDTHLRVEGDAVLAMQSRFFMDWNATTTEEKLQFSDDYFPDSTQAGDVAMQIVSSGPESDSKQIYQGYLHMIAIARESITIQSPYFIPNQAIMDVLSVAARSGVKVRIMIPSMPDHPFVYRATEYYARAMVRAGAEVYTYDKGFLHAKTLVIDDKIVSVGSANMDIRSFALNFEVNAFMYSRRLAAEMNQIFEKDLQVSTRLTRQYFDNQSGWRKFKQMFSRLLTPIL